MHETSGQKIKAKVSKSHLTKSNNQAASHRKSSSFSSFHSETQVKPEPTVSHANLKEKEELLKYFGISQQELQAKLENTSELNQEYYHKVCKNRIQAFTSSNNLTLDIRDQRVRIPLSSQYFPVLSKSEFTLSVQPLFDEIRDWLIDVIEIASSISFSHLRKGHLSEKEVKNYAAKNILLNIKDMVQSLGIIPLSLSYRIIQFTNSQMQSIFKNIIHKYPQSSSKGASRRVKARIRKIDNRQSDQFDFLYRNNIKLKYRKSGDYTDQIMNIINHLIAFSTQPFHPNDENEETNFEVFTEIIEYIFENLSHQPILTTVNDVAQLINRKTRDKKEDSILFNSNSNSTNISELRDALSLAERIQKKSSYSKQAVRDYAIGHKIPSGTHLFSEQEIEGSNFKIHDSSVLRILTKWSEELSYKLQNAQEALTKRAHKFKSNNGKFVNLQVDLKQKLYFSAQQKEKEIEGYLKYLNQQNNGIQAILAQQKNIGRYSKHDVKVGIFAAKVNQIGSQYMFRYVNKLIHSLLEIPKAAARQITNDSQRHLLQSINLVTLKIGDLMRSKYSCSEQEFLKVLSVLEELDSKHPQILKIIRIKDRLDQKDNDVLINIYFMNKVQCEIQLSIKALYNKAEKDYSNFNHFLYQIIRAKLGPISQLANIVTQYDPLINNFKKMRQFGPQILDKQWLYQKKIQMGTNILERLRFKKQMGLGKCLYLPFLCKDCFHLTIVNNPKFFHRQSSELLSCNYCVHTGRDDRSCSRNNDYFGEYNFKDNAEMKQFYVKHFDYWDVDEVIKNMQNSSEEECPAINIPQHGFCIKKNNKFPVFELYSALYEPISNSYILVSKSSKGKSRLISKIPMYLQKKKRVQSLRRGLDSMYFFNYQQARKSIDNGQLYLTCTRQRCCGKTVKLGPVIPHQFMVSMAHRKIVQCSLNSQRSLLDLNTIPQSFEKLQQALRQIQDPIKNQRAIRSIQHIKAFDCQLSTLQSLYKFTNLLELNINNNPQIKSLKGIQKCKRLVNLQCKNCDLSQISELSGLKKIQSLNLSSNYNLQSLEPLEQHTNILQITISFTRVSSLNALQKCLQIQCIDMEGCTLIDTLKDIASPKIAFLNIIGCKGLLSFDLPNTKALKSVQYYGRNNEKAGMQLVIASLSFVNNEEIYEEQTMQSRVQITDINAYLSRTNRKGGLLGLLKGMI